MLTGYFAKLKNYQNANLTPISIAAKAPIWYYKRCRMYATFSIT